MASSTGPEAFGRWRSSCLQPFWEYPDGLTNLGGLALLS
jgi:hypothetical protein